MYHLVPRGDTNEAAKDSRVMARVGDSVKYMTDGVITHMMIEGTIIALICYDSHFMTLRVTKM